MKLSLTLALAALLAFFTVLLYPLLIVLWLSWREHERAALLAAAMPEAVRCQSGTARKCTKCDWTGFEDDCLHGKHTAMQYLCPVCFYDTDRIDEQTQESVERMPGWWWN